MVSRCFCLPTYLCAEQVPRIAELRQTVTGIKNELVEQTSQAFNQVGQLASSTADPEGFQRDAEKPGQFRSLHEACLVVDALGGQARQQQVTEGALKRHDSYTDVVFAVWRRILH